MNTKLKISQTVNAPTLVEKEVDLPYYCKHGDTYFKVIKPRLIIIVSAYDFSTSIEIYTLNIPPILFDEASVAINADEFNEAFQITLNKIQNL